MPTQLTERVIFRVSKKDKQNLEKFCKKRKTKPSKLIRERVVDYINSFQST